MRKFYRLFYPVTLLFFGVFFLLLNSSSVFKDADSRIYDLFLRLRPEIPTDDRILIVNIDDKTISTLDSYPIPRNVIGEGIEYLGELGSGAVLIDIEFVDKGPMDLPQEDIRQSFDRSFDKISRLSEGALNAIGNGQWPLSETEKLTGRLQASTEEIKEELITFFQDRDTLLGNSLAVNGRAFVTLNRRDESAVVGVEERTINYLHEHIALNKHMTVNRDPFAKVPGVEPTIYPIISQAFNAGSIWINRDSDGTIRRAPLMINHQGHYYPGLAFSWILFAYGYPQFQVAATNVTLKDVSLPSGEERDITIPVDETGSMLINWPHRLYAESFRHIPFYSLYDYGQMKARLESITEVMARNRFFSPAFLPADITNPQTLLNSAQAIRKAIVAGNGKDNEISEKHREARRSYYTALEGYLKSSAVDTIAENAADPEAIRTFFRDAGETLTLFLQKKDLLEEQIDGSVCLIGYTGSSTTDIGVTPFDSQYINVGVHASAINTILQQSFFRNYGTTVPSLFILIFIVIFLVVHFFFAKRESPLWPLSLFILAVIVIILSFRLQGVYFPALALLLYPITIFLVMISRRLYSIGKEKQEISVSLKAAHLTAEAKTRFLNTMSHELRTPMNAVTGMAELLSVTHLSPVQKSYVTDIKSAASVLLDLINDTLESSRSGAGELSLNVKDFAVDHLLRDITNLINARLAAKGDNALQFLLAIDPKVPSVFPGDELRLKQILVNLLGNAVKFTMTGYLALRINRIDDERGVSLRFSAEDTGMGIKEENLTTLFEEFTRVEEEVSTIVGSGLGLSIARRFVRMMGGELEVSSVYGEGTSFFFTIPCKCVEVTEPLAHLKREFLPTVFVALGNGDQRQSIESLFEDLGVTTCVEEDISSLIDSFINKEPNHLFIEYAQAQHFFENLKKRSYTIRRCKLTVLVARGDTVDEEDINLFKYLLFLPIMVSDAAAILNGEMEEIVVETTKRRGEEFSAPGAKVLLADDNGTNRKVGEGLLKRYAIAPDLAVSGEDAVDRATGTLYDIVFMDYNMPGMNGIEAAQAIRTLDSPHKDTVIVALSATEDSELKEEFLKSGMNDLCAKPIDPAELKGILQKWLPRNKVVFASLDDTPLHSPQEKSVQVEIDWPENLPKVDRLDFSAGVMAVGGSVEDYLDILRVFTLENRKILNDLKRFLNNDNLSDYKIRVHGLKSALANIGCASLSRMALELETASGAGKKEIVERETPLFLEKLELLLDQLSTFNEDSDTLAKADGEVEVGAESELAAKLSLLLEAIDAFDMDQIGAVREWIMRREWASGITESLSTMTQSLAMYDYQGSRDICKDILNKLPQGSKDGT